MLSTKLLVADMQAKQEVFKREILLEEKQLLKS